LAETVTSTAEQTCRAHQPPPETHCQGHRHIASAHHSSESGAIPLTLFGSLLLLIG